MALVDQIIGVESGGNPNAKNPRSSAFGPSQFIESTWLDMLARHRPDLTTGRSREEVLSLRSDPTLSREMTEAYAAENAQTLQSAGLPVNAGTSYLAHFAGPQGAVNILKADPSAPISQIMGAAAVKANPFLANMTVGDLRAWADRKMGGAAPLQVAQQQQPSAPLQITPQGAAQQQPSAPLQFAQQQPSPSYGAQAPAEQMQPPPIFAPPRKPIDLSKLRAALQASGNRGFFNAG